jgi:hypothetical protein
VQLAQLVHKALPALMVLLAQLDLLAQLVLKALPALLVLKVLPVHKVQLVLLVPLV